MTFLVRNTEFDVAICCGPRVENWPSIGVRALAALCSEMGLKVGLFGGDSLTVQGVIPLSGVGGLVLVEDAQGRVHRIKASSVVRASESVELPSPFPGWHSEGLIPLSAAERLFEQSRLTWGPRTVVLGTGNRALRFASRLIETESSKEVLCVEPAYRESKKGYAAWEVERRRFEMLGGRMIQAEPVGLEWKSSQRWTLRLKDAFGIQLNEVTRVVSAGPFRDRLLVREYPPGSLLFDFQQVASLDIESDVEGWNLEQEQGRWLAAKIVRHLAVDLGDRKERLDRILKRSKYALRKLDVPTHDFHRFEYQGKWLQSSSLKKLKAFAGVPQQVHQSKMVASLECFEPIACRICEKVCPEGAIKIERASDGSPTRFLNEKDCTACGLCVKVCPSDAAVMLQEKEVGHSSLVLPYKGDYEWKEGELARLVNRKGDALGSGRFVKEIFLPPTSAAASTTASTTAPTPVSSPASLTSEVNLLEVEVPAHLLWEARAVRPAKRREVEDKLQMEAFYADPEEKVVITLDSEKRRVRPNLSLSVALFELGWVRKEDRLICPDGSCGLCELEVDGVKKKACQTSVRKGMSVKRLSYIPEVSKSGQAHLLCPCLGVTSEDVKNLVEKGGLRTPEATASSSQVGAGRCHGQLCEDGFRRLVGELKLENAHDWIDWRFPWRDWVLKPRSHD